MACRAILLGCAGYPSSMTSNQSTRGGDVNAVSGYSSTTDLRRYMPMDANGMPINVAALTARHRMDAHLDHSLRATSLGVGEAARLAASLSGNGDANGFIGGLRSTSQVGSGKPHLQKRDTPDRKLSLESYDCLLWLVLTNGFDFCLYGTFEISA